MAGNVGTLAARGDGNKGPGTAEVFLVPVVLGPAPGVDLDILCSIDAGDVIKGTVTEVLKRRRVSLKRNGA